MTPRTFHRIFLSMYLRTRLLLIISRKRSAAALVEAEPVQSAIPATNRVFSFRMTPWNAGRREVYPGMIFGENNDSNDIDTVSSRTWLVGLGS